jgi:hypothetical protein
MDIDSPIYRSVLQKMILLMRTVIDYLNQLHDEETDFTNEKIIETPLKNVMKEAKNVPLSVVQQNSIYQSPEKFVYPEQTKPIQSKPAQIVIRYAVPKTKYDPVQEYFNTNDPAEIGEETFNYFFEREIKK